MAQEHKVCVTGASGFLGSHVLKQCLELGWKVNATVRNLEKHRERLCSLVPGAEESGQLTLFGGCDLLVNGSFDTAIAGCDTVLHTASPFFTVDATEENIVPPAVEGTRNVLTSCQASGVGKVILTSSTASVYGWYGCFDETHVMTEEDWSDEQALISANNWYCVSKVRAERLAWEMSADGQNFKLAVMNPCLIFGPMLQPELNTSSAAVLRFLKGNVEKIPNETKCIVDVRDVAAAHVLAVDSDAASGKRCLLVGGSPSFQEIVGFIRDCCPEELKAGIPTEVSEKVGPTTLGAPPPHPTLYDCSQAASIGLETFISVADMVQASVESLQAFDLL
jgi:nucleoside-diphosphate-sugar epimerase